METGSSALVETRFRTQESPHLHPAQWAAQLVIGYRAFRRLMAVGAAAEGASTANDTRLRLCADGEVRALPPHDPR
jgi:hypothetical protein